MRKRALFATAILGLVTGSALAAFAPKPNHADVVLSMADRAALDAEMRMIFLDDVIEFQVNRAVKYDFRGKIPLYLRFGTREA